MFFAGVRQNGLLSLSRLREKAAAALSESERLRDVPTVELREAAHALRWRTQTAAPADRLLVEGFALVREASRRVHGQAHYPTQLMAGFVLAAGGLAEMQTGEGKTLAALLPAFVRALAGQGCHVVTANDYLAERDAQFARDVFELLGLSVGCVAGELPYDQRGPQYACDVTYGSAREFGFDFLRDRLAADHSRLAGDSSAGRGQQRRRYFALIDEADSVLLDDARTPLIIALGQRHVGGEHEFYDWCHRTADELREDCDYQFERSSRTMRLTHEGCRRVVAFHGEQRRDAAAPDRIFQQVEHALAARRLLDRNRDYVVADGRVEIVDPSTGRVAVGRQWRDGLQQAIEAKEGLKPTAQTLVAARISVQRFFRGYAHLAGLTGTARSSARVQAGVPIMRSTDRDAQALFARGVPAANLRIARRAKLAVLVADVDRRLRSGQAVLVGTASVDASEQLSHEFARHGIAHVVLNCLRHDQEAAIVSRAGQAGAVTIATNMAGRGTDIAVSDEVRAAGGLHVIATEMHASPRIDRQLIGRTARQGEPGSFQFFLALDDDLFDGYENPAWARAKRRVGRSPHDELPAQWLRWFQRAQRHFDRQRWRERRELLRAELRRESICRDCGLDPVLESIE